jgi:membrane associated rhomboid family serine protease
MSFNDRHYNQEDTTQKPVMRFAMPAISPVVKWLLIANIAIFLVYSFTQLQGFVFKYFAVYPETYANIFLQPWRIISYQFLHDGFGHIFFNMIVLFFFGPMLERLWGSKKFLIFYLVCGAMGGILYPLYTIAQGQEAMAMAGPMVGASGAIYGMMAAVAILYPKLRVYVMGIFPLPMAALAVIMIVVSLLTINAGENVGGELAHLAGMACGAGYVIYAPMRLKMRVKSNKGAWERKMTHERNFTSEVDRILDKVHNTGIKSLTRKEKKILKEATEREQGA